MPAPVSYTHLLALEDLRNAVPHFAEHFIFLEYFIIQPGKMWDGIAEILKRKAAQGVDVRLICDDMGLSLIHI